MEGLGALAGRLGLPKAFTRRAEATLLTRDHYMRFLREVRPGEGIYATAGVAGIGESEARILLVLRHLSGEPAAAHQIVVQHVTASEGRPFPWAERTLRLAEALRVEIPAFARPRSLSLEPVESRASLERAEALGLVRTGTGMVGAQDCDALDRMRTEMVIGRISDGIPRLLAAIGGPSMGETPGVGAAALEYRLLHFGWPRAGDRVELRSGLVGVEGRVRRMAHWLLDADSGRALGSAECIAADLDRATRQIAALSPQARAQAAAMAIPGLGL
jgi:acyl-CoA thioester hydrolase